MHGGGVAAATPELLSFKHRSGLESPADHWNGGVVV